MNRIAVIITSPIEYNTSAMLRCKTIINALVSLGNSVKCYMPNYDEKNKYYSKNTEINPKLEIYRFGNTINISDLTDYNPKKKKTFKQKIKYIAYKTFKKVDVFGSSLLYLKEKKKICDNIKKDKFNYLITFSDPMTAHMIGKYCKCLS